MHQDFKAQIKFGECLLLFSSESSRLYPETRKLKHCLELRCNFHSHTSIDRKGGGASLVKGLHGPRPGPEASARPEGLVLQIIFGFVPGPNDSSQILYRTFTVFSGHSSFAAWLRPSCAPNNHDPDINPSDLICSGILVLAPRKK